jgi:hypothetical protein
VSRHIVPISFHASPRVEVTTTAFAVHEVAQVHCRALRSCVHRATVHVSGLPGLATDLARQIAADESEGWHSAEVELA